MLEFRILGPLEVLDEGTPVPLGGRNQRAVLTLLLLRANEPVSSERLVNELWGEHPPRTATTSLQNTVVQLRKLLGPGVLHTRPSAEPALARLNNWAYLRRHNITFVVLGVIGVGLIARSTFRLTHGW